MAGNPEVIAKVQKLSEEFHEECKNNYAKNERMRAENAIQRWIDTKRIVILPEEWPENAKKLCLIWFDDQGPIGDYATIDRPLPPYIPQIGDNVFVLLEDDIMILGIVTCIVTEDVRVRCLGKDIVVSKKRIKQFTLDKIGFSWSEI
jgi:hypothetical protein